MKKGFPIFVFSIIFSFTSLAGAKDSITHQQLKYDTNYIVNYQYQLQIRTVGVNRQSGIILLNTEENNSLNFSTNNPFSFGLAVDYSWITLEYTQSIKGFELTDTRKGKTESTAFRLRLNGRRFSGSLFVRNTSGFYLENIEDWAPDWFEDNDNYPYSGDLNTRILAANIYYTFNHRKFSNAAAYRQTDRQIKSAGSPLIGFLANAEGIYSKTPMINIDSLEGKFLNILKAQYLKTGVFGGYMHTFSIYKRFFLHGSVNQGFLYSFGSGEYHNTEETKKLNALGISVFMRAAFGYNGSKWFAGALFSADFYVSDVSSELTSSTTYTYLKLYIGYRFPLKTPRWMKKIYL